MCKTVSYMKKKAHPNSTYPHLPDEKDHTLLPQRILWVFVLIRKLDVQLFIDSFKKASASHVCLKCQSIHTLAFNWYSQNAIAIHPQPLATSMMENFPFRVRYPCTIFSSQRSLNPHLIAICFHSPLNWSGGLEVDGHVSPFLALVCMMPMELQELPQTLPSSPQWPQLPFVFTLPHDLQLIHQLACNWYTV